MMLSQRDLEILGFILAYDGAATSHLRTRFWPNSARTTVHARLARLVEAKYLRALRLPPATNRGSGQHWLTLGPAALPLLTQALGLTPAERNRLRHSTFPAAFRHEIDLRSARLAFELAVERARVVTLEQWTPEHVLRRHALRVHDALSHDAIELVPDGLMTLVTTDGRGYRFYVELDRGTIVSQQRFAPRLRAHLQHTETRAVLIIVPDSHRENQVGRWAHQAARELSTDPGRFWLAQFGDLSPETCLTSPVWHVVGQGCSTLLSALMPPRVEIPLYQESSSDDGVTLQ